MNRNTPFRFRRTIVLGLVVATAVVAPAAGAAIDRRRARQPRRPEPRPSPPWRGSSRSRPEPPSSPPWRGSSRCPPGATLEPTVAEQPALPPGATLEPTVAGQPVLPPGATLEPTVAPTEQPGGVEVAPSPSSTVVEARDGLDWTDAGARGWNRVGSVLLLGGVLFVIQALRPTPTASAALRASAQETCGRVYWPVRTAKETSLPIPRLRPDRAETGSISGLAGSEDVQRTSERPEDSNRPSRASPTKIGSGSRQSREVSRCASGCRPVRSRKASVGAMETAISGRKGTGREHR